jgi:hypothetical protein
MCLALAAYENRMASLLETANQLACVDLPAIDSKPKKIVAVIDHTLPYLMQLLQRNNVAILICGAINGCMFRAIESMGIKVIPWITGNIDDVLAAFKNNTLEQCVMPGCLKGHGWGKRGRHGWDKFSSL